MVQLSDFYKGISCVCGGFLVQFSLGTIYTFGNMSPYIASYLKYRTSNTWVTNGDMVWIFSLAVFSQAFTMSLGGLLEKKIGPRLTCWIGGWTMSFGTILTYFAIKYNLWTVILTYGFIFGAGTGLTYSVAIATPMKWFPLQRGLVAGCVVAGYGLGSLIFNIIQTQYINPLNISPNYTQTVEKYFTDPNVLNNIPMCFVIIGFIYAIIQFSGVILMTNPEFKKSTDEEDKLLEEETIEENELSIMAGRDYEVLESLKEYRFWILWSTFFFNGIVIVTISSLYKSFGQTFISNDKFFAVVGAIAAIFNSGGRLIWGRLLDTYSYKKIMTTLTMLMTTVMGTFYFTSMMKNVLFTQIAYATWVCLLFFCLAGSFAMLPTTTSHCFGSKNLAITYGVVFTGYAMSSILGAILTSNFLEVIEYWGQFLLATFSAVMSLILTQFFPTPDSISSK